MKLRALVVYAVVAVLAASGLSLLRAEPAAAAAPAANVQIFYYPWYGNPSFYGSWRHWQQGGHNPPDDIGSNFYPLLGPYDSGDYNGAVAQQMQWIKQAGVGVIIYSWWGPGSYEDQHVAGVMNVAARYGIKVAFHIEPYSGRTAASVVSDINYIDSTYGGSPAFYRDAQHGNKPAFYVFDSLAISDWSPLAQVDQSNIVMAQTTDTSKVAYFGGMYTYDAIAGDTAPGWAQASAYCKQHGLIWAPSVGPGFINNRAVPGSTTPPLDRANGATYDTEWKNALGTSTGGLPTWVTITSFNEWHEGSEIEPASSAPPSGYGYLIFNGAYGQTGTAAQTAYLNRTAYWVNQFESMLGGGTPAALTASPSSLSFGNVTVGQTSGAASGTLSVASSAPRSPLTVALSGTGITSSTNLALHQPVTASGWTQNYVPANAVDGNTSSYWESVDNAFPQWFQVDLGSPVSISRIVMDLPPVSSWPSRTQTITIQGSTKGTSYTTVVPSAGYTFTTPANTVTVTFPAATVRYVKLTFTANTAWPAGQLSELQVYAS